MGSMACHNHFQHLYLDSSWFGEVRMGEAVLRNLTFQLPGGRHLTAAPADTPLHPQLSTHSLLCLRPAQDKTLESDTVSRDQQWVLRVSQLTSLSQFTHLGNGHNRRM